MDDLIFTLNQLSTPFVLTGDFNFFPEDGGDEQRDVLTASAMLADLTYPLWFADPECRYHQDGSTANLHDRYPVDGTFHGYGYDAYKATVTWSNQQLEGLGRLDWIFSRGMRKIEDAEVHGFSISEVTGNCGLSDHLALFVDVTTV